MQSLPRTSSENKNIKINNRHYRLPNFKQKNSPKNKKGFHNLSSDILSPPSLTHNLSIKSFQTNRISTILNRTKTLQNQTPRQTVANTQLISQVSYIRITLHILDEEIEFKSYSFNVEALTTQAKKIIVKKLTKYHPFVLESLEDKLSLSYYLSQPNSKISCFQGKHLHLKPYFISPQITIDIKSFDILKVIGAGGFSNVFLVRFKGDGQFYAMKVISKTFITKNKKQGLIVNQRDTMVDSSHPLHTKLHWAIQTKDSLIFVMQFYPGGELFGLIKRFHKMPEKMVKFYIIEILLALQHLHEAGIAYRDLKPQNILLDRQGHVHLGDFGLTKPGLNRDSNKAFSFCGSPQYMPPQVIKRKGHNITADFYSLGALLYQLITGLPPFYCRDAQKIYKATLTQQIIYFSHFSSQLKSLLEGLLCKEHEKRLGSNYGVREVMAHPWFGNISTHDYIEKRKEAPVKFDKLSDLKYTLEFKSDKNEELVATLKQEQSFTSEYQQMFANFSYSLTSTAVATCDLRKSITRRVNNIKMLTAFKKVNKQNRDSFQGRPSKMNNYL